jgi:Domain of unknown function (DUF4390)
MRRPPVLSRRRRDPLTLTWLAVLVTLFVPAPARADDMGLSVGPVETVSGALCVSYRVERPFTPRLEETLFKGMPATVTYEVGLWKRRAFWFDKLVVAIRSEHKIVYDEWARSFRVRSGSRPPRNRTAANLDSLRSEVFSERRLPIASEAALDSSSTYYVSVRVTLRPVAAEDLGEIESWLAGEKPEDGAKGLPRYLLGLAVSLSGLGERTSLQKSERFIPARLSAFTRPG